nr:MAG TPA: hypothetical protein [Caudoviricetes sp.]DAT53982.1 MAG TPA: hypothetical protein [Caudoviricetes sp.]
MNFSLPLVIGRHVVKLPSLPYSGKIYLGGGDYYEIKSRLY